MKKTGGDHTNLWSRYDLHVVSHDFVLCEVN